LNSEALNFNWQNVPFRDHKTKNFPLPRPLLGLERGTLSPFGPLPLLPQL